MNRWKQSAICDLFYGFIFIVFWGCPLVYGQSPDPYTGPMASFLTRQSHRIHEPDRDVDIERMVLRMKIDDRDESVDGDVTYEIRPFKEGTTRWVLSLGPGMHIREVLMREVKQDFTHRGEILVVHFREPLPVENVSRVTLRFFGKPKKGLYFSPTTSHRKFPQVWSQGEAEDNHFWFPTYDYPDDRFTTETYWTVRKPLIAVSNGEQVEVIEGTDPGWRTFHWSMTRPHVSYLISVAVGNFQKWSDRAGNVPIEYYVAVGISENTVRRAFGKTPAMIEFYSKFLDFPYPYAKYAQVAVDDFLYGGMENITATTLSVRSLRDEIASLESNSDGLVAHELAHQWFGDLLTCRDWSHAWLNEGFATYFTALWFEHDRGPDEFSWTRHGLWKSYIEESRRYVRPMDWNLATHPMDLFDRHTYPKGALILHQLRTLLGDELFTKGLRHYVRTNAWNTVTVADFQRSMEEATGRDLDEFFSQWVHSAGHPKLNIQSSWDPRTRSVELIVRQVQKVNHWVSYFRVPTQVILRVNGKDERHTVVLEGPKSTFRFPAETVPDMMLLDPGQNWIMEQEWDKTLEELEYQLIHAPDVNDRAWAAEQLGWKGTDEAVQALKQAYRKEKFYGVKTEIARALGQTGRETAYEILLEFLDDPDARVRKAVLLALGELPAHGAASRRLEEVYHNEKAYGPRAAIIQTLVRWNKDHAKNWIERGLKEPSFLDEIAAASVQAMEYLEPTKNVVQRLQELAEPAHSLDIRNAALLTLAKIRPDDHEITRWLEKQLNDRLYQIRSTALDAILKRHHPESIQSLKRALVREWDDRLKTRILRGIETLEKLSDKSHGETPKAWEQIQRELLRRLDRMEERIEELETQRQSSLR